MVIFKQKKIVTVKSVGETLSRTRRRLHLTLAAVEKKLGINARYLEAIENGEWAVLPGEVYAKNFLRKYVEFLGLNFDEIRTKFEAEKGTETGIMSNAIGPESKARKYLLSFPKIIRHGFVMVALIVVIGYLGLQVWTFLSPPELYVLYPDNNYLCQNNFVTILGKVGDESIVRLNDEEVGVGSDGFFRVDMDLNQGLNVIKVEAEKSYGRKTTEYRRVIVE